MTTRNQAHSFRFRTILNVFLSIYLLISANFAIADTAQTESIQTPVDNLHGALISIMKSAETMSFDERYKLLEDVIFKNFNTPLISRVILSRYWKSLDETSQNNFIDLFNQLTISTYVSRFDSYNEETFKHLSIEPMKKGRYMVKTELVQSNNDNVSFNYIVQSDDNNWKIISVIANGINDLSLKRGEYSAVIKDQGFNALIENIKQKISDLQPNSSQ